MSKMMSLVNMLSPRLEVPYLRPFSIRGGFRSLEVFFSAKETSLSSLYSFSLHRDSLGTGKTFELVEKTLVCNSLAIGFVLSTFSVGVPGGTSVRRGYSGVQSTPLITSFEYTILANRTEVRGWT